MIFKAGEFTFDSEKRTFVAGILNVTPDSFSDGGRYFGADEAVRRALEIEAEGADLLDIGAFSTRPGHEPISSEEEMRRLAPVLDGLQGRLRIAVSVDTFNVETAEFALSRSVQIINDVSGVFREDMARTVKKYGAGWILTHTGADEDENADVLDRVNAFFRRTSDECEAFGIKKESLCLDGGFGFGKSYEENMELLANFDRLETNGCALMAALSRKRMLGAITGRDAADRTEETLTADTAAIFYGADFIRVHDVRQSVLAARVADEIKKYRRR